MGTGYWKELIDFLNKIAEFGMVNVVDVSLVYATDSVEEAIEAHSQQTYRTIRSEDNEPHSPPFSAAGGERALPNNSQTLP
jgi:3-dehydroquinate dehydratase